MRERMEEITDFNGGSVMWRRYKWEEERKVTVNKWHVAVGFLTSMDATGNKYQKCNMGSK